VSLPISHNGSSYRAWQKTDLSALVESKELGLSGLHKQYLRSRWLEQVLRMEDEVARATNRYYALRLITVIGSLLILVLVSVRVGDQERLAAWAPTVRYLTITLSLLVSISVALEQVFHYGERWWQGERLAERLKTEGWRFLQLSGRYRHYANHTEAFPVFANQVEDLSQREVEVYVTEIVREKEKEREVTAEEAANTLQVNLPPLEDEQQLLTARATLRDRVTRHLNQRQVR
jgi:hypothetical protein